METSRLKIQLGSGRVYGVLRSAHSLKAAIGVEVARQAPDTVKVLLAMRLEEEWALS